MRVSLGILLGVCLAAAAPALGQDVPGPPNVAVVANLAVPESMAVAEFYRTARGIPETNVCLVDTASAYAVSWATYRDEIEDPVAQCLQSRGISEQVLFIAVTWGVPAVISDVGEEVFGKRTKAVDGFLADPFGELADDANPYYEATDRFSRENGYRGYLVTRLDGPSADVAFALVERAVGAELAPELPDGVGYFDLEPNGDTAIDREVIAGAGEWGNGLIRATFDAFEAAGWPVVLDENDAQFGTAPALTWCPEARWYLGWYQLYAYNDAFDWADGAVGFHIDSFSAVEYRRPGSWAYGALLAGVTATAGAVWEPYTNGILQGDIFLRSFVLDGVSVAEAAWRAIPRRQWMNVVFGDPLYSRVRRYEGTTLPQRPGAADAGSSDVVGAPDAAAATDVPVAEDLAVVLDVGVVPDAAAVSDGGALADLAPESDVGVAKGSGNGGCAASPSGGRPPLALLLLALLAALRLARRSGMPG